MIKMQFWRRLEMGLWSMAPCLIAALMLVVYLAPKHIAGIGYFMPALPLIPIFYWGLNHGSEMPYWFVFALGLVMDAVVGTPMGLTGMLYVFFLAMLHAQRKYIIKEGFVIKWVYFALLLLTTSLLNWLMMFFVNGQASAVLPVFFQWLLTLCCYPILHKSFDIFSNLIGARKWQIRHGR